MKIVSQLDANGYFVGTTEADESPLEPGVYLLPGGCVDAPAPNIPAGKQAKWLGAWVFQDVPAPAPEPEPVEPGPPTPAQQIEAQQIEALERETLLPRPVRDFMLVSMEQAAAQQGAAQGLTAEQSIALLRANNSGYRKVKELDEQIAALRALL